MHPNLSSKVGKSQQQQKKYHDKSVHAREFNKGDNVYVRSYSDSQKWIPGTIQSRTRPVSSRVEVADGGRVVRHHDDQVRARTENAIQLPDMQSAVAPVVPEPPETVEEAGDNSLMYRYPVRDRKTPEYLKEYKT